MEDKEILELFRRRSEKAIASVSDKYKSYCMKIAVNILGTRQDAEECVNDTFFKAWELIPPNEPQMLSTFLGKLTRNLAINTRRREFALKRGGGQADAVFEELSELISCDKDIQAEAGYFHLPLLVLRRCFRHSGEVRAFGRQCVRYFEQNKEKAQAVFGKKRLLTK